MNESNDLKNRIMQMRQDNKIDVSEMYNEDKKSEEKIETKSDNQVKKSVVQNNLNSSQSKDEEAFKLLASKFNQSVEVILELTKRVEKLETLVRLQSMQSENIKTNKTEHLKGKKNKNKLFFLVMFILGVAYLVYFFNFDLSILNQIIAEFSNIFRK